jgi:uncharacterized membrane protein YoaK (UPF0700 family)
MALDRVFVANMTGNVVFIGFATAGAGGFSLAGSVVALAGFVAGVGGSSLLGDQWTDHRGRLLRNTVIIETVLVGAMTVLAATAGSHLHPAERYPMLVVLGVAMGGQMAAARLVGVRDLTTTVLTAMLTGLVADMVVGTWDARISRRIIALLAMFGGAAVGAVLVLDASLTAALAAATGLLALVATTADRLSIGSPDWSHPPRP